MNETKDLTEKLNRIYERNSYVRQLDMTFVEMKKGKAILTMPVNPDKHTNLYGVMHGGAIASLADTVMGVACASYGNRVVTIDMNVNFIKSAAQGDTVHAVATVIHAGRQTMVVESEMRDNAGILLAKARGTFMVIGKFEELA